VHYFTTITDTSQQWIIRVDHVVTFLLHDCDKLRVRSAAKRIGVEMIVHVQHVQHVRVRTTVIELVILAATVVVHCTLIKIDPRFSFSDISDDTNTDDIKI